MAANAAMTYATTSIDEIVSPSPRSTPASAKPFRKSSARFFFASCASNAFSSDTVRERGSRGSSVTCVLPCWEVMWMKEG